jgi:hypothetical protein
MSTIKVHAGDYRDTKCFVIGQEIHLQGRDDPVKIIKMPFSSLTDLEVASEENVKRVAGSLGWGLAGGALLGGVGALAGVLVGGNKKEVTFIAHFNDGTKILATGDSRTYTQMHAALFDQQNGTATKASVKPMSVLGMMALLAAAALVLAALLT